MTNINHADEQIVIDALRAGDAAVEDDLRLRLAADAAEAGLLDIAYRTVDTPIGSLLLAATPAGLVRIAFALEDHDQVLARLADKVSPRILHAPGRLDDPARQIEEYFEHRRRHFNVPVDLQLARGFRRTVLDHLRTIPYGSTESYTAVAAAAGNSAAVRAAASACSHNPVPIVVPCHRVVRSDGSMGGYLGGLDVKRLLLSMEAA